MGLEVVRLLEGEVHRQAVALGCGLQLEEEGIGTRIVAATHVLRETCKSGCTPNPAFLPVGSLHLLHTGNHHFGKAVDGYLPGIAGCVSSIRHSFRHPLPDGPSGRCPSVQHKLCGFIRRIRAVGLAPLQIILCTVPIHHKAEEADFTGLKEFYQLLVCLLAVISFVFYCFLNIRLFS